MKSGEPNTVPCGTPILTSVGLDFTLSSTSCWVLPVRKHLIYFSKFSETPMLDSFFQKHLMIQPVKGLAEIKADDISIRVFSQIS